MKAPSQEMERPTSQNENQSKFEISNIEHRLPFEEVKKWGESFDVLMSSTDGQDMFREFLKLEYSEENIMFWTACNELKKEDNPEMVEEKARLIYEDYISILSPKEVSLDSRVREIINGNMIEPNRTTFDEAQIQIYKLMHQDSYPRFLNSRVYKDVLARVQTRASLASS